MILLYEMSVISKSIETKYVSDCQKLKGEGEFRIIANKDEVSLGGGDAIL